MSLFETAIDLGEKCETAFEPFPDGSGSAHMTSKTPSSGSPTPSAIALRAALEDVGNRISFMRGVLRGDWEPLESVDEWLVGLDAAASEAGLMVGAALDRLRVVGRPRDFGGMSYASYAEAIVGLAGRIVTGDIHDPLAPMPILDIGADGRIEDPRELRMNMFRRGILMAKNFEALDAQVRRSCSVLVVRESMGVADESSGLASGEDVSEEDWRRSFTSLAGKSASGPRRLWRIVSRIVSKKRGSSLDACESCGWDYKQGKVPSNRYRDRDSLLRHEVRGERVMVRVGASKYAYAVEKSLPDWFLDELDREHPIEG